MTSPVDRLLSEFMDAWTAGARPDPDAYLARAPAGDRAELAREIAEFLVLAPDPDYDRAVLEEIEAEPIVAEALLALDRDRSLWPALLPRLRARVNATTADVARALLAALDVRAGTGAEDKTRRYLDEMEDGTLPPAGIQPRVLEALGRLLRISPDDLRAAGELSGPRAAGAFARAPASADLCHLEVFADLLGAPAPDRWDEIDELFRGAPLDDGG